MLPENNNTISLNKFISDSGLCSRRKADMLIKAGKVTINGVTANVGNRVAPDDEVLFEGKQLRKNPQLIYLAFYKPKKIICSTEQNLRGNISDIIRFPDRIFPILTIDKASEGLIFMTNDGDLANDVMQSGKMLEKEYTVTLNRRINPAFLQQMAHGIELPSGKTQPCFIEQTGAKSFKIILTHDQNRLIQRMCAHMNYKVVKMKRIRIMHVRIQYLKPGRYRYLTDSEVATLKRHVKNSLKSPSHKSDNPATLK